MCMHFKTCKTVVFMKLYLKFRLGDRLNLNISVNVLTILIGSIDLQKK